MYSIKRIYGPVTKLRMEVKTFRTAQAMHTFLNKQYSNDWSECTGDGWRAGIYMPLAGTWKNVKEVTPFLLTH